MTKYNKFVDVSQQNHKFYYDKKDVKNRPDFQKQTKVLVKKTLNNRCHSATVLKRVRIRTYKVKMVEY